LYTKTKDCALFLLEYRFIIRLIVLPVNGKMKTILESLRVEEKEKDK
jgi:hypothetical protein